MKRTGKRSRDKENPVHKGLGRQQLMVVFVAGGLLLNLFLLALWDRGVTGGR